MFFFRIEFLLLTTKTVMDQWVSVPYIWRVKGRNYVVAEEGYRFIYATAVYPELILFCFLILSRKISACYLREILFHSPFFPFHLPSTNVVLVPTTKTLTYSLTVIRSRRIKAVMKSHENEHDFRPTVST